MRTWCLRYLVIQAWRKVKKYTQKRDFARTGHNNLYPISKIPPTASKSPYCTTKVVSSGAETGMSLHFADQHGRYFEGALHFHKAQLDTQAQRKYSHYFI